MDPFLIALYEIDGIRLAEIRIDDAAGFYLYILDPVNGQTTHDHLQDTLEIAMEQAEEDYGLAIENWHWVMSDRKP